MQLLDNSTISKATSLFKESDTLLEPVTKMLDKVSTTLSKLDSVKDNLFDEKYVIEETLKAIVDKETTLLNYKKTLESMLK